MRRSIVFSLVAACLLAGETSAQGPETADPRTMCKTLAECLAEVRDPQRDFWNPDSRMGERIATFGTPAVDALVAMLADPDPEMRERAGDLLFKFPEIDPKHLPAIAEAWRAGGSVWLPRVIAATQTDEALNLLWQDFVRGSEKSLQVDFALASFGGERIRPRVLARFAQCRTSASGTACGELYELLRQLDPPFPPWSAEAVVEVARTADSARIRYEAETVLVELRHAEAREAAQRRLAAYPADAALENHWDAQRLIDGVADYGPANHGSGPAIARFLDKRFDEDLRANAALALGRIEDRASIPALLALEPELADDWLLAYNVAESLGRLHATEARPLLERLAREHWQRGVRNNAERALNMIAGGPFARPGVPGDGAPFDANQARFLNTGNVRWDGDEAPRSCAVAARESRGEPDGRIPWSGAATAIFSRALAPERVDENLLAQLRQGEMLQGFVVAVDPLGPGQLVGFNGGEFGGGMVYVPESGVPHTLLREPVSAVWHMGGRIYVAAGLSHLVLDYGHLYVIDPTEPRVERVIRLPASPTGLTAVSEQIVVVATYAGDLAIRADGTLLDPQRVEICAGND